jgi:acyl dehydratase
MAQLANFVVAYAGDHRRLRRLRCRFSGMVLPGDTITFTGRVAGNEDGLVRLELNADNQKGERVLSKALAELTAD